MSLNKSFSHFTERGEFTKCPDTACTCQEFDPSIKVEKLTIRKLVEFRAKELYGQAKSKLKEFVCVPCKRPKKLCKCIPVVDPYAHVRDWPENP